MSRVLITAGGSGIGQAMAMAFEQSGFDVWITDIDAELLGKCPVNWKKNSS
jgi:short-subunit dehydrogenase involved in D-alanine esterification of teichoic acids